MPSVAAAVIGMPSVIIARRRITEVSCNCLALPSFEGLTMSLAVALERFAAATTQPLWTLGGE